MSVFIKLNKARIKLQNTELTKSGHNKFAGYKYFELGDFLPTVQNIFSELGLCGVVSYGVEIASLTIVDTEDNSNIVITSPMGSAALKGCHEVQNIGAVETYQRRYLYTTAMAIVEHDALDATTIKDEPKITPPKISAETPVGITPQQISSINSLVDQTQSDIAKLCAFFKKPSVSLLDRNQAIQAIAMLEKKLGADHVGE